MASASCATVTDWPDALKLAKDAVGVGVLCIEHGFETADFAIVAEQDILGDRMVRQTRQRRAQNFLQEASSLAPGDLVTHIEHGVGRYLGLKTIAPRVRRTTAWSCNMTAASCSCPSRTSSF